MLTWAREEEKFEVGLMADYYPVANAFTYCVPAIEHVKASPFGSSMLVLNSLS